MPIAILRPDGIGDDDEWGLVGSKATKHEACDPGDPVSHDDDTSYCSSDFPSSVIQSFTITSMPGGATGVRNVVGKFRWRPPGDNSQQMAIAGQLNGVLGDETTDTQNLSASYFDFTVDPFPRPNGGSWTLSDLADATMQIRARALTNPVGALLRITSFWLDVEYDEGDAPLEGFREVAGRTMRVLQHTPGVTTLEVPLRHLKQDLWDDIGLAHDSIARAEELLDNLEDHGLVTNWRRRYSAVLGMSLSMNGAGSLSIDLLNMEPVICTLFDTLSMPIAVTPDASISEAGLKRFGVTTLNAGALRTEERTSPGFIVAADELKGTVQLRKVLDGIAKMNHRGMLVEDAFANTVDNSCFIDGLTGWTSNLGTGGAIALDATIDPTLFKDAEDGQQMVKVTKGSAGDVELTRADVTSSTGDRRAYFWIKSFEGISFMEWNYQRAGGSPTWWNDTTETWDASKVWNKNNIDTDEIWTRIVSKRMTSVTSGNAAIGVGNSTGLENHGIIVGQIQAVEQGYITSDAIVDDAGVQIGGAVERVHDEIDNGGTTSDQVVHPDRYTVRVIVRAYQDSAGITEGVANRHVLWNARWNADGDRDEAAIEKVSGQVRFAFRRFISSSEDALAFVNVTLTLETEYEVAFRATSPSDGELGLSARTLSAFADGVKGTDDQATGVHSSSTQITQFYYGSTTSGIGLNAAANYIRYLEAVQRVIPDSEILGRR